MKNDHVTDEVLQAFLLKEIQENSIAMHLNVCSKCQERLEDYEFLINNVRKIKSETFSFDVTSLVMEKIESVEIQKEKNKNTVLYIIFSIISTITLALSYPSLKIIFHQFKSFSMITNVFMLVSVSGVFIFLMNDLFRQYKRKESLLLQ